MSQRLSKTRLIADRRREIEAKIASLQSELEELVIAERVLARLGETDGDPSQSRVASSPVPRPTRRRLRSKGTAKPSGSLPTFDMVLQVLEIARSQGHRSLSGREIVNAIDKEFWPGVGDNSVLPNIYRYVKDGRMRQMADKSFALLEGTAESRKEAPRSGTGALL